MKPNIKIITGWVNALGLAASRMVARVGSGIWQCFLKPIGIAANRSALTLLGIVRSTARLLKKAIIRIITNKSLRIELRAALFIASLVTILDHHHLLESLQQDNLQLALPFLVTLPPSSATDAPADSSIKAVFIDDLTYEKRFRQESPLDRAELTRIIAQLLEQEPKVLVIDLDLSPGPAAVGPEATVPSGASGSTTHNWSTAETELYRLLKQHKGHSTEIVLSTPMPVFDPVFAAAKTEWMRDMCSGESDLGPRAIRFGLPHIPVINGVALSYDQSASALAAEVNYAASSNTNPQSICAQQDLAPYTRKFSQAPVKREEYSSLLNYRFASAIKSYDVDEACPAGNCAEATLAHSVVFFGGRYSPADSYGTPVGVLSGAMLHAGSYFSITRPIQKTNVIGAYLLDIILGCLLGVIVYRLTSLYRNQRSLGSIAMNLAVQPLFPYLMVVTAGLLLARFNLWLNPAPMIFGMAIHAGLVRIEEPYIEEVLDQKILGISETTIKQLIYCAVVFWAWIYLGIEMNLFAN